VNGPAVVCVGLATLDTILVVERHPERDGRVVATERVQAGGGPAATAAVTLARLGVEAAFVGAVGDDAAGAEALAGLAREGVDVSEVAVVAGATSPESTVLVEQGSGARTIVHVPGTVPAPALSARARELCAAAAWVHADQAGYAAVRRLDARISLDGGNPIAELDLAGVALYAPTETELLARFGGVDAALSAGAETVVVTRGDRGSAAASSDGERIEVPAAEVDAVSTLGAGDVFHGALLASLVRGVPLREALVAANACAALSCRALDGRSAIPTATELAGAVA
jgi:sulfofructose kinase